MDRKKVIKEFAEVINKNSLENESNTPDFILAEFLTYCLDCYNWAVKRRDNPHLDWLQGEKMK